MTKLLSLGELLIDMLPQDSQNSAYLPIAGGAPANVAVGYAKLGGNAAFCGAAWDDFKLGAKHSKEFKKIAIYGNKEWQERMAKIGNWFITGDIEYFENATAAIDWLDE